MLCGAKTRRGDRGPCKNPPVTGSKRCRMHGGHAKKGIEAGPWKTGKHSRYAAAAALFERWEDIQRDPKPHDMTEEIHLYRARIDALLTDAKENAPSGKVWFELRVTMAAFREARQAGNNDGMAQALNGLNRLIVAGSEAETGWGKIYDALEGLRRVVETDRKAQDLDAKYMTLDDGMQMVATVLTAIKAEVQDAEVLKRVMGRLNSGLRVG